MKPLPSAERLKLLLDYDPETGRLTHARQKRGRGRNGEKAGSVNAKGYVTLCVDGCRYYAHRVVWKIMTGEDPKGPIDHHNGRRSDNRWANLRPADEQKNGWNAVVGRRNKSGYRGVFKVSPNSWAARARIGGEYKHLGSASTPEAAYQIYLEATKPVHGDYHVTERP